jgi:hypothetical protein
VDGVDSGGRVKRPEPNSDETVRVAPGGLARPRAPGIGSTIAIGAISGLVIVLAAIVIAWLVWPQASRVAPPTVRTAGETATSAEPELPIETATVAQILVHQPADLSIFRVAENPQIVVLDFASLKRQKTMLDRVAALIEKAGLPRDRILNADELDRAVTADGDADAGFYYGHDYSAASLRRFFSVADRAHVPLTPEEALLRHVLDRLGWLKPDAMAGLISAPGVAANVTTAARDTILTHELSHGEYFSNKAYASYVHRFVVESMTPVEQAAFRTYLAGEGYDTTNGELIENETQAYLLFTPDPKFFSPAQVHMTASRRAELRGQFLHDMPTGWLKDLLSGLQ